MFEGLSTATERKLAIEQAANRNERAAELMQEREKLIDIVRCHSDSVVARYASELSQKAFIQAMELKKGIRP